MLYLFGRLALSDSFYFNQDLHPDEQPDALAAHRQPEAAGHALRVAAQPPQPRRGSLQPLASPPAADSGS
jgi:hypothetical protein